jgi:hypothetical protein
MTTSPPFRFKRRTYLHFDLPVGQEAAERLACDPARVASHSFYPFLGFTNVVKRITKDASGQVEQKEKHREIKIAAHRDAALYSHYADLLAPLYEEELHRRGLDKVVTAFRKQPRGGTNIDFAGEVFRFIDHHRPCVALAFDLEKFFDTLDHELLKQQWLGLVGGSRLPADHFAIFKSLTRFCWVDRGETYEKLKISPNKPKANNRRRICNPGDFRRKIRENGLLRWNPTPGKGIPQGSPLSALLSNIYMLDFDETLHTGIAQLGGLYRRYCDDIMIIVPPEHRHDAEGLVATAVDVARLTFNGQKTDRAAFPSGRGQAAATPIPGSGFSDRIQYLGFTYDGSQTLIRPGSLARYYGKMRAGVSLAKQTQRKHNKRERDQGQALSPLKTRKLYIHYSYLINRRTRLPGRDRKAQGNFLTYAYRASEKLDAPEIRSQVRNHWKKLQEEIDKPIRRQLRGR